MPLNRQSAVGYAYRGTVIPLRIAEAIDRWVHQGAEPGQFLHAVLCNDLREALGRADPECGAALHAMVVYLYNEAPSRCWGSPEKVAAWAALFEQSALERRQAQIEAAEARDAREAYAGADSSDTEDARLSNLPHDA